MYSIKGIKRNRAGVSTIAVIAVVAIVIVAAAAVYLVLSDKNEEETWGPGTAFTYDISQNDEKVATMGQIIVGQSADDYFVKATLTYAGIEGEMTVYELSSKSQIEGAKKTGTIEMDTMDGKKTLEIWEYTVQTQGARSDVKSYADPSTGLTYRNEATTLGMEEVQDLTAYDLVWQKQYKQSGDVGKTYKYSASFTSLIFSADVKIVADCIDGKFGVMYDFSSFSGGKYYTLCNNPQGLPDEAVDSGQTAKLTDTIDGEVDVGIWTLTEIDGSTWKFYVNGESKIIYKFDMTSAGMTLSFVLKEKP